MTTVSANTSSSNPKSRAQIKVEANERLFIDGKPYRVTEHPALPGIPYIQRGARGFVIQLASTDGERMALKYFKLKYRVPELVRVAASLHKYADLSGMKAARRTVFTQQTHAGLLNQYPALEYGMLMPWLPGTTWYDLITGKVPLTTADSLRLAKSTADVLAGLEAQGVAHTDIAGANVMVDRRAGSVELVDIEEIYGPDQPPPVELPAGQDGYQHKEGRAEGQWSAEGDRFAAAVLICEMLGWADPRLRQNSADEHFFSSLEMQDATSARYRMLLESLRANYTDQLAELLESAWTSNVLSTCPPLAAWKEALSALQPDPAQIVQSPAALSPVVSGRRSIGSDPAAAVPTVPAGRLQLEGVKICRNCGAENVASYAFCKRCGYFIGTFDQRRPPVTVIPKHTTGQQSSVSAAPPPQPIQVKRDNNSIIVARRVGDPGKGLQRIETPKPPQEPEVQANAGSWLVLGIILMMVLAIIVLALLAGMG
ncbi:MAG: hypothetical protein KF726_22105 [Anaerolineae bacterium]|nr:hypothetical protein [Anaerolineae bacterium]